KHAVDHEIAAVQRAIRMIDRRIQCWRFWQAGDERRFGHSELFGRLAEVKLRSGFESVNPVSQINLVCIQREDLLLAEPAFDLDREQRLLNLSVKRPVGRKKQVTRKLHGQRGSALDLTAGLDIAI